MKFRCPFALQYCTVQHCRPYLYFVHSMLASKDMRCSFSTLPCDRYAVLNHVKKYNLYSWKYLFTGKLNYVICTTTSQNKFRTAQHLVGPCRQNELKNKAHHNSCTILPNTRAYPEILTLLNTVLLTNMRHC